MDITIKNESDRFNCRVGAIIYNENKTKILLEKQKNEIYIFPGGRLDIQEDSNKAIKRELNEELNLKIDLTLKYIIEMFVRSSKTKYHEIGFYYLTQIKESQIGDGFKSLDGNGVFYWIPVHDLNNYHILATPIKNKIIQEEIDNLELEHLIYKEY